MWIFSYRAANIHPSIHLYTKELVWLVVYFFFPLYCIILLFLTCWKGKGVKCRRERGVQRINELHTYKTNKENIQTVGKTKQNKTRQLLVAKKRDKTLPKDCLSRHQAELLLLLLLLLLLRHLPPHLSAPCHCATTTTTALGPSSTSWILRHTLAFRGDCCVAKCCIDISILFTFFSLGLLGWVWVFFFQFPVSFVGLGDFY